MKIKLVIFWIIITKLTYLDAENNVFTDLPKDKWPEVTMINSVEFTDGSFATSYPGCSFLLDTGEDTLAVTCKHSLWTAKNDKMTAISFDEHIKNWRMHIKNDTTQYLIVDKLINKDKNEKISEWNTEKDYLLFTIEENNTNIKPLKISPKFLTNKVSKTFTVGWAFKDREGSQRVYSSKFHKYLGNALLQIDDVRQNLAGTSGSPVINSKSELVGIISSWKFDNLSKGWFLAPCSTDYLWEILYQYWLKKMGKKKNPHSFKQFVKNYELTNKVKLEFSDNLFVNLFFYDWLKKRRIKYGEIKDFDKWSSKMTVELNRIILLPEETKNELVHNEWINQYLNSRNNFDYLNELTNTGSLYLDWKLLCKFALDLANSAKFDKAIEVMTFTIKKFSDYGQVYFFLGEIYSKMKDYNSAINNYEICLKKYPGYPFAIDRIKILKKE